MTTTTQPSPPAGPAVDARGLPTLDPTANVIALTEAAVKRLDDLAAKESRHVRELMSLRAAYDEKLRDAESKRIDAIRAVDVGAVNRAAEVAATQAATLATAVAASAETLRAQVATTATAFRAELAAALEPIQKRTDDLTRAQYEQQGQKQQVIETRGASEDLKPILDALAALTAAQNQNLGQRAQVGDTRDANKLSVSIIAIGLTFAGLMIGLMTFILTRLP